MFALPRREKELGAVSAFFRSRHPSSHHVYSCGAELAIPPSTFDFVDETACVIYPHTAGVLTSLITFCLNVDIYLNKSANNVAAVCCKTGKGRSGMLSACLLLHQGVAMSSSEAIALVNKERTPSARNAVCVPSQIRYVYYYEALLRCADENKYKFQTLKVMAIRITSIPNFDSSLLRMGCTPFVVISVLAAANDDVHEADDSAGSKHGDSSNLFSARTIFNQHDDAQDTMRYYSRTKDSCIDMDLSASDVRVRGDTVLSFFSDDVKMMQLSFHTCFVEENNYLAFEKSQIDIACKDTKHRFFAPNLKVEVFFSPCDDDPSINTTPLPLPGHIEIDESDLD